MPAKRPLICHGFRSTRGNTDGLKTFQHDYANALAAAWRAPDGDVAMALVNLANTPLSFPLNLDRKKYQLPNGKIYRTDEGGRRESMDLTTVDLTAGEACVIEFTKK